MTIHKKKLVDVVITAAGNSTRLQNKLHIPKQYRKVNDKYLLSYSIEKFSSNENINKIWLCIKPEHSIHYNDLIYNLEESIKRKVNLVTGSTTRQKSVYNCLLTINNNKSKPDLIFVHDASRPNFKENILDKLLLNIENNDGVIPIIPIYDTVKRLSKKKIVLTENREELFLSQTPQLFYFQKLLQAHNTVIKSKIYTDDAQVCEDSNLKIYTIEGDLDNVKITTIEDINEYNSLFKEKLKIMTRVGMGFDVHKFKEGNSIRICGIDIPFHKALMGHSDADVVLHALTDAIYGSIGDSDIGEHFPPSDIRWANANSEIFLKHSMSRLLERNGSISNIDITIICEEPKMSKYKPIMVDRLSELVDIETDKISIKATTTENLGFTGRREGIAAQCIITITMQI
ncbi:MAG: 2-C-methyl-D-erythritol 2,4-cyclodiphosphate synthase [Alphaproteobacteria bacterium]